ASFLQHLPSPGPRTPAGGGGPGRYACSQVPVSRLDLLTRRTTQRRTHLHPVYRLRQGGVPADRGACGDLGWLPLPRSVGPSGATRNTTRESFGGTGAVAARDAAPRRPSRLRDRRQLEARGGELPRVLPLLVDPPRP